MKYVFEQIKGRMILEVLNMTPDQINSDGIESRLLSKYSPRKFEYLGSKHVNDISSIPTGQMLSETGMGGQYSPESMSEKVTMERSMSGDKELFQFLAGNSFFPNTTKFHPYTDSNGGFGMQYVGYAVKITGDTNMIAKLKLDSDTEFENFKDSMARINQEIEVFIEKDLKPKIHEKISMARAAIKNINDTKAGLR